MSPTRTAPGSLSSMSLTVKVSPKSQNTRVAKPNAFALMKQIWFLWQMEFSSSCSLFIRSVTTITYS